MKTMTCKQLGGACDLEFHANTFEEIAKMSHEHGSKMFREGDEEHIKAGKKMKELMKDPQTIQQWMKKIREEFESKPEN